MDAVLQSNSEVKEALKGFVLVKLDSRDKDVKEVGGVRYIPVMVFYSPSGKEISRRVGFKGADHLVKLLKDMSQKARNSK